MGSLTTFKMKILVIRCGFAENSRIVNFFDAVEVLLMNLAKALYKRYDYPSLLSFKWLDFLLFAL